MDFKRADLANATEAIRLLLSELALEDYRFTIEPREPESDVGVEYAATDGWRCAKLRVRDAALLASRTDPGVRSQLASQWGERLAHAKRRSETEEDVRVEGTALGHSWADQKANALRDRIRASDWPDFWEEASNGPLPRDLAGEQRDVLLASASRAAHERWLELLNEQRSVESTEEDEHELEAAAARFEASLERALPPTISAERDGSQVYLQTADGLERTVASLEDVGLVIEEWTEQPDNS
jgi:hypothetical protein